MGSDVEPTQDQIDRFRSILGACREPITDVHAHTVALAGGEPGFAVEVTTSSGRHRWELWADGLTTAERRKCFAMVIVVESDDAETAYDDVSAALPDPGPGGRTFAVYGSDAHAVASADGYYTDRAECGGKSVAGVFYLRTDDDGPEHVH